MHDATQGDAFSDIEFPVEVWLAAEEVPLGALLDLEPGGVLPLTKDPDGPVDLVVNGTAVATGELVVVDGRFAFRVTATASKRLADLDSDSSEGPAEPPESTAQVRQDPQSDK